MKYSCLCRITEKMDNFFLLFVVWFAVTEGLISTIILRTPKTEIQSWSVVVAYHYNDSAFVSVLLRARLQLRWQHV